MFLVTSSRYHILIWTRHNLTLIPFLLVAPSGEYYTLRSVLDEHALRFNSYILNVCLFQRGLTALKFGLTGGVTGGLRCGRVGGGRTSLREEGKDGLAAQLHQLVVLQRIGILTRLNRPVVVDTACATTRAWGDARRST